MIELRDKATHLLIEEIRFDLSRIFQSSIINYIDEYESKIGKLPFSNENVGMLSLVIPGDNNIKDIGYVYGSETKEEVEAFLSKINTMNKELKSNKFMVDINCSVYIKKKEKDADICLSNGPDGDNTKILERLVDPKDKFLYGFQDLTNKLKQINKNCNSHYLNLIIKKYKIKENADFSYNSYYSTYKYSERCFNYITNLLDEDNNFLENLKK